MNVVIIAAIAALVVAGFIVFSTRRHSSEIGRGIEGFHREMNALAPRHPSAGVSGSHGAATHEAPDVQVSRQPSDSGEPTDYQKPDSEA